MKTYTKFYYINNTGWCWWPQYVLVKLKLYYLLFLLFNFSKHTFTKWTRFLKRFLHRNLRLKETATTVTSMFCQAHVVWVSKNGSILIKSNYCMLPEIYF